MHFLIAVGLIGAVVLVVLMFFAFRSRLMKKLKYEEFRRKGKTKKWEEVKESLNSNKGTLLITQLWLAIKVTEAWWTTDLIVLRKDDNKYDEFCKPIDSLDSEYFLSNPNVFLVESMPLLDTKKLVKIVPPERVII